MLSKYQNPFFWLAGNAHKKALWLLGTGTLLLLLVLTIVDQPLRTAASPNGIVSFELAKNIETSRQIIDSWSEKARLFAAFSLGIDYLFLVCYALFLGLAVYKLAQVFSERKTWLARLGIALNWGVFLAAAFDALENYCLIRQLFGTLSTLCPLFAHYFASAKFLLLVLGLSYLIIGLLFRKRFRANNG